VGRRRAGIFLNHPPPERKEEIVMIGKQEVVGRACAGGRCRAGLLPVALLVVLAGCGSSRVAQQKFDKRVAVFPAKGQVTLAGKPLAGAIVTLHPKGTGAEAHALSKPDGSFTLTTYETDDGAAAGEYAVSVVRRSSIKDGHEFVLGPNELPPQFSRAETSPLTIQIAEGSNDLPPIEIAAK